MGRNVLGGDLGQDVPGWVSSSHVKAESKVEMGGGVSVHEGQKRISRLPFVGVKREKSLLSMSP